MFIAVQLITVWSIPMCSSHWAWYVQLRALHPQNGSEIHYPHMMATDTPRDIRLDTWSIMSDTKGETTTTTLRLPPVLIYPSFMSNTKGRYSKQRDFPNPVGSQTKTSFQSYMYFLLWPPAALSWALVLPFLRISRHRTNILPNYIGLPLPCYCQVL